MSIASFPLGEPAIAEMRWVRRSNLGWAWLDGVDAPMGCSRELYRVTLRGSGGAVEMEADRPEASIAEPLLTGLGSQISGEVIQVGDLAISRPASFAVTNS